MKPKRADMSITIIIAAIIGLVALVVIIAIFTNTTQKTAKNIGSCTAKGGLCSNQPATAGETKPSDKCGGDYPIPLIVSGECESTTPTKNLCCLKIKN